MQSIKGSLTLLLTALIWGLAFVAQQVGGEELGAFSFNGLRSFLGAAVLVPVVLAMNRRKPAEQKAAESPRATVIGGVLCGVLLFAASSLQQIGLLYTTVGKAGFITALYIVFVPVISIFLGKRAGRNVWIAVAVALVGLYLLCMKGAIALSLGDSLVLACAFIFSFHILVVDYFCVRADNVQLSFIQFLVCGILSVGPMVAVEHPQLAQVQTALLPLLYAGILSCGVGYTLQIVGQKNVSPTAASILMSLEAVFSVLGGWVILHQALTAREGLGCVLMFAASILAQIPGHKKEAAEQSASVSGQEAAGTGE